MAFDGEQQIRKVAVDPGPNRFVLERAGDPEADGFIDRHREVVRPEMYEPFTKRRLGGEHDTGARRGLRHVVRQQQLAHSVPRFFDGVGRRILGRLGGLGGGFPLRGPGGARRQK